MLANQISVLPTRLVRGTHKHLLRQENKIPTMNGKQVIQKLDAIYPKVTTPLAHSNTFQLIIATILSAQCTDAQVNKITPALFQKYPDVHSMARANVRILERLVKSTGFYHVKARRIRQVSETIVSHFGGKVPSTMEELLTLPGIGRKTANIVLSAGFGKVEGIAVDTHVFRVSRRIGLTKGNNPGKIENDLMKITPKKLWPRISMLLIFHGRRTCFSRKPKCSNCVLSNKCLYFEEISSKQAG